MSKLYKDYYWKGGKPFGKGPSHKLEDANECENKVCYKIVSDPYQKRISVEKYDRGEFNAIVYDSSLLDFRKLKPEEQNAWQKTLISENSGGMVCEIRDQDDRLILIEEYAFCQDLCRECRSSSPHGILVSIQKMYYSSLGDAFDGAILYDRNEHPVMFKKYAADPATNQFINIINEQWDMSLNERWACSP